MKGKKTLCIVLTLVTLISLFAFSTFSSDAYSGKGVNDVILYTNGYHENDYIWYAWTWSSKKNGYWVSGEDKYDSIEFDKLETDVVFVLLPSYLETPDWEKVRSRTENLKVENKVFVLTGEGDIDEEYDSEYWVGEWVSEKPKEKEGISETAFDILSPVSTGNYKAGESINVKLGINKYYYSYSSNGRKLNSPNSVILRFSKGEFAHTSVFSFYEADIGTSLSDKFTPPSAGKYTVRVGYSTSSVNGLANDNYIGKYSIEVKPGKKSNTISVKTSTKSVKANLLIKSNLSVKPITIKNAKGAVTVVKVKKGTDKKIYKKITVKKKTGVITFKKGKYAKKTYKIKLKITAKGNSDYKSKTVNKVVKVRVK